MGFSERIYELRQGAKLSQKELAQKLGVAQASINYWEKGQRTPSADMVVLIADYFNVSTDYLMDVNKIIGQSQKILDNFSKHPENWIEKNLATGAEMSSKQSILLKHYNNLNESGQDKAVEQVELLTKIPEYQKEPPEE